jgi:hypothetical protein
MKDLEPELAALLEHRPIERHVPPDVRARVLARARDIVAAGGAIPTAAPLPVPTPAMPAARGRRSFRIALAAAVAVAAAAAGAVAALHRRSIEAPRAVGSPSSVPTVAATNAGGLALEAPAPPAERSSLPPVPRPARSATKEDPFTAELELLQRAHAAYTRHEFSVALALVAEHARRFPKGRLAEQREALRVRSLAGSGRTVEAHRAAAAFAVQFPRSVLLPRLDGGPESSGR